MQNNSTATQRLRPESSEHTIDKRCRAEHHNFPGSRKLTVLTFTIKVKVRTHKSALMFYTFFSVFFVLHVGKYQQG